MRSKTPAERKAAERKRRKESGQILVQEWIDKSLANKLRNYAKFLREKHENINCV